MAVMFSAHMICFANGLAQHYIDIYQFNLASVLCYQIVFTVRAALLRLKKITFLENLRHEKPQMSEKVREINMRTAGSTYSCDLQITQCESKA